MLTAIFGGTFNPLHNGHYEILKALNNDDRFERILLMPDRIPPHKSADALIDDDVRIKMCEIVAGEFSKCELFLFEFQREGRSYTYDTITLLKEKYPQTDFAFVCGGDMLVSFDKWWNYEKLMKMLPFIVFSRTDTDESCFIDSIDKFRRMGMEIIVMEQKIPAVSSTEIRNAFDKSAHLLPDKVFKFLNERGVYNGKL